MKTIHSTPLAVTNRQFFNNFSLPIGLAVVIYISLGFVATPVRAENIQNYQHIAPKVVEKTTGTTSQNSPQTPLAKDTKEEGATSGANEPVSKPKDGKGALPTFAQADINGDHYVTKSELENFPYLLQVFDKVDAGEDGKLEQHEYQNLEMETKREGEVR